ncbi:MAG: MFS transporter [Candidatus Binataceae bacterium]
MSDTVEDHDGQGADALARGRASGGTPRTGYQLDFWLVFTASFAIGLTANLFVFFPVYIVKLGGNAATIGAIVSVGALAALAARPGLVPLIDWRGRRSTALWSLMLEALAIVLYVPAHSLGWPIYAVRVLQGAVDGTARVALFAMVYEILPDGRRGQGMSMFSLSGMGPAALGPLIGEALIKRFGFNVFFYVAAMLCLGAAAATAILADDRSPGAAAQSSAPAGVFGYRALIFNRNLLPLWVVALAFAFAVSSRLSFVAPFAYQKGIARVGWYFALYSGIAVVLRLFGRKVLDRVGVERILGPSLGVLGIGIGMLAFTGIGGALLSAAVLGGLGHSYAYPALSAMIIAHTPAQAFGHSSAVYISLFDFASMLAPYLLGLIATVWGYAPMFVIAGLVAIVGAVYFKIAERRRVTP